MLNLLLILLLIHYIGLFLFKQNTNVLSCGIFGQCANIPKKLNSSNIKILGLFNESRGKNSCGVTIDSEIYHGMDKDKLFTDFIKGKNFNATENPLIIGHTRAASFGAAINEHNVHPFGFDTNAKGGYKFIGVHNGTLYNHEELAEAYGIEIRVPYVGLHGIEYQRTKIDSEILLEIIHKTRSYKVLSEYIGKAALVWTDTDAPNVSYFWSGKSRNTEHYLLGAELEERPMNIWIESKNNFYFSSIPEPLEVIGGLAAEIFQIEYNTVYQVTNGDFERAIKTPISRSKCFQTETYVYKGNTAHNAYAMGKPSGEEKEKEKEKSSNLKSETTHPTVTECTNIYLDKPLHNQNDYRKKVYNYRLRYWQKGHLIEGIHCYIPNYGFYKLDDNNLEALVEYNRIKGLRFYDGDFVQNKNILFGSIPFQIGNNVPTLYYFLQGVMLRTKMDYDVLRLDANRQKQYVSLSFVSVHPVIDISYNTRHEDNQNILYDGVAYTGTISLLSFEKTYHISKGKLLKTVIRTDAKTIVEKDVVEDYEKNTIDVTPTIFNPIIFDKSLKNILEIERNIEREEAQESYHKMGEELEKESKIEEEITDIIDSEITPCLMSFQNCREQLELMPGSNQKVIETKRLINDLILTINTFAN